MKRTRVLAFALFVAVAASASCSRGRKVERKDPDLSMHADVLYRGDRPYSGTVVDRYENGSIYRESEYKNGIRQGEVKEFALNGRVKATWHYAQGKQDGLQRGWYAEGQKRFEYRLKNGLMNGIQTEWHQSGTVYRREVFVDGEETDKKILYSDGSVFSNYSKRDGRIYGLDGGALCMQVKREGEK